MNGITWVILGVVVAVIGVAIPSWIATIIGAILIFKGITEIETSGFFNYIFGIFGAIVGIVGFGLLCNDEFHIGAVGVLVGGGVLLSAMGRTDTEEKGKSSRRRDAKVEAGTCDWCGAPLGGNYYECKVGYCSDVFCSQQCALEHIRRMHPDER